MNSQKCDEWKRMNINTLMNCDFAGFVMARGVSRISWVMFPRQEMSTIVADKARRFGLKPAEYAYGQ